ncbi:LysE family translocator [Afifella marina]|uniref:Threonine/homoserine/homoserine lactone efflux protein n=1 Tax=Afifella marina DSM 2698 TaxID=1120955 RepID=A0A1G5MLX7_AFIMA|nr:LysE family translocator [Afifella marina]MBK1623873.1 LysE family translocator [Afifella marina DSM 2698]MBK1627211.1 LysE family translocator [Afifella marina]MBK5918760.1 lysine transporter LysE [Afifella marina]RAI22631.1 lysine transporter LysE [Afifella marina DSM 2698]SCZ25764.1 Threonine/homoserine/homoserine lactone efflux protein [Afifella marina DSM 2698]
MDLHDWIIFAATVLGVSLVPGPSTLVAFAHGAAHGWLRSISTAFGNALASTLQATAASVGLGLLITSSGSLLLVLKYAGAAYLIYVGVQIWRSASRRLHVHADADRCKSARRKLFLSGFTVAISNPKAIAFFTALFPQFLSLEGNSFAQLGGMVAVVAFVAFSVALFYGCVGAWVQGLELSRKVMSRIHKTTGGLFVASGVGLALSRNS